MAVVTDRVYEEGGLVRRHGSVELVEHWVLALSGLILLASGLLELPLGRRYYVTEIPSVTWAGDFFVVLYIHYAAAILFVAVAFFHLFYHGLLGHNGLIPRRGDLKAAIVVIKSLIGKAEEPPFHKYLPEQRIAYAGMAFIIAMLIFSGLVKTYDNLVNPQLPYILALTATWVHNVFSLFFFLTFLVHVTALAIRPNRPLIRGIFTGFVRLDYVHDRHKLWLNDIS